MKPRSKPLVSSEEAGRFSSLAKMISLCHSLEQAHIADRWASSDPDPSFVVQSNCSKKLREAIMFSTCGSREANRIKINDPKDFEDPRKRTLKSSYVDKYIDGWTSSGRPKMWQNKRWRKKF